MNTVYIRYIVSSLRDISVELRFKNLIELYKIGVYTEDEWRNELKTYFDWVNDRQQWDE